MRKINELMPGVWEFEPQKLPEAELTARRLKHRTELEKWKEREANASHIRRSQMDVAERAIERV